MILIIECSQWTVFRFKAIMAGVLGEPKALDTGCLPKKNDVFNFYKKVRSDGILKGKWKEGAVTIGEVAREVLVEICALWCKTPIPSLCERDPAAAAKEVSKVVKQCQDLLRISIPRRKSDFGAKFDCLFDLAICKHVMVVGFQPKGKKRFVYTRSLEIEEKDSRALWGPRPPWTWDP